MALLLRSMSSRMRAMLSKVRFRVLSSYTAAIDNAALHQLSIRIAL